MEKVTKECLYCLFMEFQLMQDCGGTFSHWKETYLASNGSNSPDTADGWHPTNESPFNFESSGPNRMDVLIKDDPTLLPMTNFEAKYLECGESIYELTTRVVLGNGE